MLSLSTSLIPQPSDLSFEAQVRWVLDGGIPGLTLGQELSRHEIRSWIREAKGSGHLITAIEAPCTTSKTTGSSNPAAIPCLFAIDESERRLATESCLKAISSADRHEIANVILLARSPTDSQLQQKHEKVIEDIQAQKDRINRDPADPEVVQWLEKLQRQQQNQLAELTRKNAPHPDLQRRREDSLLRTLDAVL